MNLKPQIVYSILLIISLKANTPSDPLAYYVIPKENSEYCLKIQPYVDKKIEGWMARITCFTMAGQDGYKERELWKIETKYQSYQTVYLDPSGIYMAIVTFPEAVIQSLDNLKESQALIFYKNGILFHTIKLSELIKFTKDDVITNLDGDFNFISRTKGRYDVWTIPANEVESTVHTIPANLKIDDKDALLEIWTSKRQLYFRMSDGKKLLDIERQK